MGVSVENKDYIDRIDHLQATAAKLKFLSLEPLLGPLHNLDLGPDSPPMMTQSMPLKARPMDAEWVVDIQRQCSRAAIPFFFKQWGGFNKKKAGRKLDGRTWDQMPAHL